MSILISGVLAFIVFVLWFRLIVWLAEERFKEIGPMAFVVIYAGGPICIGLFICKFVLGL